MALELDHVFICCSRGAPEGDALVRLGFNEGSANTHPGQGTANRRFFFRNAFLELLWVSEPTAARNEQTRRTKLWERWSGRASGACPFGLVFRPRDANTAAAPFATWAYRPNYLPAGLAIEFAEDVPLEEPELVYLPFLHHAGPPAHEPTDHALPMRELCGVTVGLPSGAWSKPSRAALAAGLVSYRLAAEHMLELAFLTAQETVVDLRPTLPLLLRGVLQDTI
jgi:hypothetical protein